LGWETEGRGSGSRWLALALAVAAACSRPLPEGDSPAARVYVQECGLCHPPIHPGLMTPAMWRIQVGRMDELRKRRGLQPLDAAHRALIVDYLDRNAG
jgi:hypothetical protein